jgi:thioredoxin reductase (NADPH)
MGAPGAGRRGPNARLSRACPRLDPPVLPAPPQHTMSPSSSDPFDLLIVGAGPCGIAAALAAQAAGLAPCLVDRGPLCAAIVGYPIYMHFFSTPDKLEVGGIPFPTAERNATRREALTYYRKVVEAAAIETRLFHEVTQIDGHAGAFRVHTRRESGAGEIIKARNVVMATGGFHAPNLLDVPGEDLPKVSHHYIEAHPYWRQEVLVVGGSNSAVEAALELYRTGARVTLVHFGTDFDRGVKPWILPDIRNRIEAGEVAVRWGHRVAAIHPESVVLRDEETGQEETLANDRVLALTGWRADPGPLLAMGVPVDPVSGIPAHDPETMETPVPGLFIAGVLAAGHDANRIFIENGRWHGAAIARRLVSRS